MEEIAVVGGLLIKGAGGSIGAHVEPIALGHFVAEREGFREVHPGIHEDDLRGGGDGGEHVHEDAGGLLHAGLGGHPGAETGGCPLQNFRGSGCRQPCVDLGGFGFCERIMG